MISIGINLLSLLLSLAMKTAEAGQNPTNTISDETVFPCEQCDRIVHVHETNGKLLNIQPGEIVCLNAANNYRSLKFAHIKGTPEAPIIIRNCGGVSKVYSRGSFGMKFEDSEHFKLIGDGAGPDTFGIQITTERGFFLTLEHFSTDFEIARIEIKGASKNGLDDAIRGFAGIGVKTSPYQDCELFTDSTRKAWIMRNISIHDNYIHDTGGEGIYMGHGFYKGRAESKCPDGQVTYSHSIKGVRIYNNLIENVGYDGIQIKNADEDVKVFKNIVRNYGTRKHKVHNEGLLIGEGATGEYYENIIDTGTGNGCQIHGLGNLYIHDNLFLNPGEYGIYAAHGNYVVRLADGYFTFTDNLIYNPAREAFVFFHNDGGQKKFTNNYVINAEALTRKGAPVRMENNAFYPNERELPETIAAHFKEMMELVEKSRQIGIEPGLRLSN